MIRAASRRWHWSLLFFIPLATSTLHCSSSDTPPPGTPNPPIAEAGTPTPGGGTGIVTPSSGGTITTSDGAVTVEVPPGAVASDTTITITPSTTFPSDAQVVPDTVYDFGPDGIVFSVPVTMTINYDPAKVPSGIAAPDLRIHKAKAGGWDAVADGTVDTSAHRARAQVLGFSTYGIRSLVAPDDAGTVVPEGELVATDEGYTDHIRVFGSHVYWSNGGGADGALIRRVPLAGGAPEVVVSGLVAGGFEPGHVIDGLAEANGKLFFVSRNALFSVPTSGGAYSPIASGAESATFGAFATRAGVAADATHVYWAGWGAFTEMPVETYVLKRVSVDATLCGQTQIDDTNCLSNTYCGDLAYMVSPKTNENKLCTEQGANIQAVCCSKPESFAAMHGPLNAQADLSEARDVVVDGGFVYWAEMSETTYWIMRRPTAGGAAQDLATGATVGNQKDTIRHLALGGGFVYWTESTAARSSTRAVKRVAMAGGTPETVVTDPTLRSIAADATNLYYWVDEKGLYARALAGGAPKQIAKGVETYSDLAVSSTHVYFANSYVAGGGRVQEIRRIAK